jgi:hypothetical protein
MEGLVRQPYLSYMLARLHRLAESIPKGIDSWVPETFTNTEPVFIYLFRGPGIDSQPGGPVRQPYLSYLPARLHSRYSLKIVHERHRGLFSGKDANNKGGFVKKGINGEKIERVGTGGGGRHMTR